jgi:hypothetical protein
VESPARCPYDNEGRSASAVAGRPERGLSTPQAVPPPRWPHRIDSASHPVRPFVIGAGAACQLELAGGARRARVVCYRGRDFAATRRHREMADALEHCKRRVGNLVSDVTGVV